MLLTSSGLRNPTLVSALSQLLGKPFSEAAVIIVLDPAVAIPKDKGWLLEDFERVSRLGFKEIDLIDVGSVPADLVHDRLRHADVVYVEGGDQRHLVDVLLKRDLVAMFHELLSTKVYLGMSAGSMIFGRRYDEWSQVLFQDGEPQPAAAPFPLFDWYLKPHFDSPLYPERTQAWADRVAGSTDFPVYFLDDDSAVRVQGEPGAEVIDVVGGGRWRLLPARTL